MWIVRLALRNPYSVGVLSVALLIMGAISIATMYVDIFPEINLPVVSVIWNYPGLPAEDIETRIVAINERAFSTTVQGVSKIESQALPGIGNIRVFFDEDVDIGNAVAQITSVCQTILRIMPPGMTPPNILPFNAANVPVAELILTSDQASEQQLFDFGLNFLRLKLFTIKGLATPAPYGGAGRQINVDVDPLAAMGKGISPQDISQAIQNSNIIVPAGVARIGKLEYNVVTNASPTDLDSFKRFPVKAVNGREVLLGEVATVADSHTDQTNLVRINGARAVYLNLIKKANASALDVIGKVKGMMTSLKEGGPPGLDVKLDFDQSQFVKASVMNVLEESLIAAILVSLMILLFLGSLRSVLIVCTSIPLSAMASIICLKLVGNSINVMTLGGIALSIGMLVDDATVEVENINRNRAGAANITEAILRAASQIALPALATTFGICVVFFPVIFLTGPSRFLFTALSESVVFAMIASYILSRTLVPVLARLLLRNAPLEEEDDDRPRREEAKAKAPHAKKSRWETWRTGALRKIRDGYTSVLDVLLAAPWLTLGGAAVFLIVSLTLPFFAIGRDFFPPVDVGILKIHYRAPAGSRLEETERLMMQAEQAIHEIIPDRELETINANIGVPTSYNLAFVPTDNATSMDAEIMISLKKNHAPSEKYREKIRSEFARRFPGSLIYFQPADMVSQILNFGLPAPVDLVVQGRDIEKSYDFAVRLRDRARLIPGLEDVIIRQFRDYPTLSVNIDRSRAILLGVNERDATSNLLYALTGTSLVAPSYFINPQNHVNYAVVTKLPVVQVASVNQLLNLPVRPQNLGEGSARLPGDDTPRPTAQPLGNLATVQSTSAWTQLSHQNVQRVIDVLANVEGRDLGGVIRDVRRVLKSLKSPPGVSVVLRGQSETMESSFSKLGFGMVLATVLVYLLMVMLFQSWGDPLIIMVAVPGSICGILWALALTGTTINVESIMGAIMAIGIAVSNSNLLLNFANDFREQGEGGDSLEAAREAGKVRLRPILMTALAMILGMIPMALGLGEGGAQNAPLGRAVIGGLTFSTLATLFVVPVAYAVFRKGEPTKHALRELYFSESKAFDEEEGAHHA